MQTVDLLENSLMLGKIDGRKRRGHQMRWMDGVTNTMDMNLGKLWAMMRDQGVRRVAVHGVAESGTAGRLNNNSNIKPL